MTVSTSTGLDHYEFWPENPFWSFQYLRMMGKIPAGGGDFAEIALALRSVEVGVAQSWHDAFRSLADRLDEQARESITAGDPHSARSKLFRATNYHQAAGFFLSENDPRHAASVDARRSSFRRAAPLASPAYTAVEIPYENGTTLPGYIFPAATDDPARPAPAAVIFGGTDAVAEEMYFFLGRTLSRHGVHTLAIDGPGQGEALRRGIPGRHDWEVPAGAAFDFLAGLDTVDPDRIAIVGQSLGGYLSARAAAMDSRFAACVIWGALYDLPQVLGVDLAGTDAGAHFTKLWPEILMLGPDDDLFAALAPYTLRGVVEKISCPTLVMHGESDRITPFSQAEATFADLTAEDRTLRTYPAWTPGCTHCQVDAMQLAADDITGWLTKRLLAV